MLAAIKRKFHLWRHPLASQGELILDRRRIYIFPNRAGLVFILTLLAIFLTSVNYGVNLGYALVFLILSCGWLGIIFTFRNLAGLGLTAKAGSAVFAGELAHFSVHLANRSRYARYAIAIESDAAPSQFTDIPQSSHHQLTIAAKTVHRGWITCPRVRLQTVFPLGLLKAWAYWQSVQQVLVYPAPEQNPPPLPYVATGASGSQCINGDEEFGGVRNYQIGDSLKQLAWRQIARHSGESNEQLLSKHFESGQHHVCTLDFNNLPAQLSAELKLARLCAWLLIAEQEHISYSFRLGRHQFKQNSGPDHQQACLTALALYHHD